MNMLKLQVWGQPAFDPCSALTFTSSQMLIFNALKQEGEILI